ncbi:MAG: UDP-N-acetylglucosamine 1-carboxyvinyltransferase, partial [Candidatus Dadabacteria bacterium]
GARPIDQHLQGLAAMGADIEVREGYVHASAARLCGSRISFDMPTVGGTENLLMAAALADGETVLENAAREPEIVALAELLQRMGVPIEGAGTSTIRIEGQDALSGAEVRVIPDRIEAGTWLIAAAATGGEVRVTSCRPDHIEVLLEKLIQAGCQIDVDETRIELSAPERLQPCDIRTAPFPGFPTDLQAQWMSLMAVADGATEIIETIFENRFMHVPELMRMGAQIRVTGNVAVVRGPNRLSGAPVMATDLRASAGLVIAALAASGTTEILRIYHLERGYERLDAKLRALGADVELFVRDATVAHVNAAQAAEDRRTT